MNHCGTRRLETDRLVLRRLNASDADAVFRNWDGSLYAERAVFDPDTGMLRFSSKRLGRFIILAFAFEGEEFSPEFYAALAALDELAALD